MSVLGSQVFGQALMDSCALHTGFRRAQIDTLPVVNHPAYLDKVHRPFVLLKL